MAQTAAWVDITISDNWTMQDAFQFGTPGDLSWSLTSQNFECQVKASRDDTSPLVTFTSGAGQIVVDDPIQRVVHFNVPMTTIQASLPPAEYVYDFIMYDNASPPFRTGLMQGKLIVKRGVSET